jgi:uncharacterized membrane protein YphA (DoxX/SURF4 family)
MELATLLVAFGFIVRLLVGMLFLVASWSKLSVSRDFRIRWLSAYGVFPPALVPALSLGLPILELASGITLLLGAFGRYASLASAVVLGGITLITLMSLARGQHPPCGCFGDLTRRLVDWRLAARNLVLLAGLVVVAGGNLTTPGMDGFAPWTSQLVASVVLGLAFAVFVVRYRLVHGLQIHS